MINIGVIGAQGFVGSALANEISSRQNMRLVPVVRGDDWKKNLTDAEIIIYAANSGKRFFAEQNPKKDFEDTVLQVDRFRKLFGDRKLILISSMSARTQLDTAYGRHRRSCELLMDEQRDLVVRLGPMFGGTKKAGALYDILAGRKVYQSSDTRYGYVPVSYNARKILDLLNQTGLVEIGAKNGISLIEIAQSLGSSSEFVGGDDTQIALNPPADAPDAYDVLSHARSLAAASQESRT